MRLHTQAYIDAFTYTNIHIHLTGISIKLQEEERERRDNYVPSVSALEPVNGVVHVDVATKNMLDAINFGNMSGLQVGGPSALGAGRGNNKYQRK